MKKILAGVCCIALAMSMNVASVLASAEDIVPENSGAIVAFEESKDFDRGAFTCIYRTEYVDGKSVEVATITGFDQNFYASTENKSYNTNHTLKFPDKVRNETDTGWAKVTGINISHDGPQHGWIGGKDSLNFTKVIIPNTVRKIGQSTFRNLKKLEYVDYAEGIRFEDFGYYFSVSFEGCSNLKRVGVNGTYKLPDVENSYGNIGTGAFSDCISLIKVELPEGITSIGNLSFQNCTSLQEINIPSTTKGIEYKAFLNCSSLSKVTFNLNAEGKSAFNCLYQSAFEGCTSLQNIKLPLSTDKNSYTIGVSSFKNTSLKGINIPENVTSVGSEAFAGTKLESNALKTPKGESYGIAFFGKNTTVDAGAFTDRNTGVEIKPIIAAYEGTGAHKYAVSHVGNEKFVSLGSWEPYTTRGDINNDGKHNLTDIKLLKKRVNDTKNLKNYNELYDINKDGKINFSDVKLFRKYVTNSYYYR